MTKTHTVPVQFKKTPNRVLSIDYLEDPLVGIQARHQRRTVLIPDIDLNAYTCRAVIDWAEVQFMLARDTQFRFLQDVLGEVTGRRDFVATVDPGPGKVSRVFRPKFQEPSLEMLEAAIARVKSEFGFEAEPEIVGLEVSVDFSPKVHSDDARAKMVTVLMRHLLPKSDFITNALDHPRFTWGAGTSDTMHVVGVNIRRPKFDEAKRYNLANRSPAADATFYIGEDEGPLSWRVMDKVIDQQNRTLGTHLKLSDAEKRARMEVTLGSAELKRLGLSTFSQLRSFSFGKLQGRYFPLMLPTFQIRQQGLLGAAQAVQEELRLTKFLSTGVIGLKMMDDARQGFAREERKTAVKAAIAAKQKVNARDRTGSGPTHSFKVYEALGRRVETALLMLTKREAKAR